MGFLPENTVNVLISLRYFIIMENKLICPSINITLWKGLCMCHSAVLPIIVYYCIQVFWIILKAREFFKTSELLYGHSIFPKVTVWTKLLKSRKMQVTIEMCGNESPLWRWASVNPKVWLLNHKMAVWVSQAGPRCY